MPRRCHDMDISSYPHAIYPLPTCSSFESKPAAGPKRSVWICKNAGDKAVKPRYVQQGCKLFVPRSRRLLHIAMNGLQSLLFRHDPLPGFVGRNAR